MRNIMITICFVCLILVVGCCNNNSMDFSRLEHQGREISPDYY